MEDPRFQPGDAIDLEIALPAFPTAEAAHRVDWSRRLILPPGRYVILRCGRSDELLSGDTYGGGHYYEISGPSHAWVRQNYLIAGQHHDWPWDLTRCLEPIDWDAAWGHFLRRRVESTDQALESHDVPAVASRRSREETSDEVPEEPGASARASEAGGGSAHAVPDDFGMFIAEAGDLLPDFDDAFDIQD